jgi:site-specific DNA recombinase
MTSRVKKNEPIQRVRCAIYTRVSSDERLGSDFNSLDAQREAAESYVASQRHEGWIALEDRYDDPGYSGGTMERPSLKRLLRDVEAKRIDIVVVYKVDRLSRSLLDFTRIVDALERHGVSFVSITQQFSTTSSMGRLTLNMLLSFAQFEREIAAERIRDKIAAAKRKGMHTGGMPILGYDTVNKRLVVNDDEAKLVRWIFRRFCELGSATQLAQELNKRGQRTKSWTTQKGEVHGGRPWNKAHLYRLLNNRTYRGEVTHRGEVYPGEHDAIVERKLWDDVHRILADNYATRSNRSRAKTPALLKGVIRCAHCDCAMGPTFTRKKGKTYRYYLCVRASKHGYKTCPVRTVAAGEIEEAVVGQLRAVFRSPELVARTFREAKALEAAERDRLTAEKAELEARLESLDATMEKLIELHITGGSAVTDRVREVGREIDDLKAQIEKTSDQLRRLECDPVGEQDVIDALERLDPIWDELFPAEQSRIVRLLVERVDVRSDGLEVRLRADGLRSLVVEVGEEEEALAG